MNNELFSRYPNGFYFFDKGRLIKNYNDLYGSFKRNFDNFSIAYSFKTNYTPYLCNLLRSKGSMAEVVSEMELNLALQLGYSGSDIIFNGPFKSRVSLETAIKKNVCIHVDSLDELKIIRELLISIDKEVIVNVGIRTNFCIDGERPSRFGIDVESEEFVEVLDYINSNERFLLKGLHCHHPFRNLNSFEDRVKKLISVCNNLNCEFEYLDIGGGFYSRMPQELVKNLRLKLPSFEDYSDVIRQTFNKYWSKENLPKLIIEPGSALVADVLDFYCRVVSIKRIGLKNIATLSGSKFNIFPNIKHNINLPIHIYNVKNSEGNLVENTYDFCGYTCIENDVLYENYTGFLEVGDIIRFKNVGSYSIVMKPPFILPNYPIITENLSNQYVQIKSEETFDYIFQNFII